MVDRIHDFGIRPNPNPNPKNHRIRTRIRIRILVGTFHWTRKVSGMQNQSKINFQSKTRICSFETLLHLKMKNMYHNKMLCKIFFTEFRILWNIRSESLMDSAESESEYSVDHYKWLKNFHHEGSYSQEQRRQQPLLLFFFTRSKTGRYFFPSFLLRCPDHLTF